MTAAEFGGVDVDLLADYIGGALAGTPDESVVATLIADDPAWQDAYTELSAGMAAVGAELGRFEPEPMPAELTARLDTLLTSPIAEAAPIAEATPIAEAAPIPAELAAPPVPHLSAVRGPDAVGNGAQGVRDEKSPERKRGRQARAARRLRWATPIAIAAGAVAFVGFGLDYLAGRQSHSTDSATSAGAGLADSKAENAAPAAPGRMQILSTGIDYTAATLAAAPDAQALSAPDAGGAPSFEKTTPRAAAQGDALSRLRPAQALQDCLDAIGLANGFGPISPLTVDYARFDGKPAIVVRFTAGNGLWAWASGPSCGSQSGDADTLGKAPVR